MITILSTPTDTAEAQTVGCPGPQGASAQAASVVILSEETNSVTAVIGSYALISEGTTPYPHIVLAPNGPRNMTTEYHLVKLEAIEQIIADAAAAAEAATALDVIATSINALDAIIAAIPNDPRWPA